MAAGRSRPLLNQLVSYRTCAGAGEARGAQPVLPAALLLLRATITAWRAHVLAAFPQALSSGSGSSTSSSSIHTTASSSGTSSSKTATKRKAASVAAAAVHAPAAAPTVAAPPTSRSPATALTPEEGKLAASFAAALGIPNEPAARMCARFRYLLYRNHAELAARAEELQSLLALPTREALVRRVLLHNPQLLTQDPETWARRVNTLAAGLSFTHERVLVMARSHPMLLYQDPEGVLRKVEALSDLLSVPPSRGARIVATWPTLALMSPTSLSAKLRALCQVLELPREHVARICVSNPVVLQGMPGTIAANRAAWEAAAAGTPHVRAWEASTLLLTADARRSVARWRLLRALSERHAPWRAWLEKGRGVGALLFRHSRRWWRAEYLMERLEAEDAQRGGGDRGGGGAAGAVVGSGGGSSEAPGRRAAADEGLFDGAPRSFRKMLLGTDEEFASWQPGFAAWAAKREQQAQEDGVGEQQQEEPA